MNQVIVITGGGSGIGKAVIQYLDKEATIIISGRHADKLQKTAGEFSPLGYHVMPFVCDTSKRESVIKLAGFASSLGEVTTLIHCAGVSPAMVANPETVLRINALGTVYVNQEFSKRMNPGGVIVDVASNSAYQLPSFLISTKIYQYAEKDEDKFLQKLIKRAKLAHGDYQRAGFAYAYSKNFVTWYASKCAFDYGKKGIRVCSVSPGLIDTGMGKLELSKNDESLIAHTAEHRLGRPEELGFVIACAADKRNGYLAGVDILADGGEINGRKFIK